MTRKINPDDGKWHLDRKVPIAVTATLFIGFAGQTATAAWYMSKLDARVEVLEQARVTSAPQADRLTRVETKLEAVTEGITEIKAILRAVPAKR